MAIDIYTNESTDSRVQIQSLNVREKETHLEPLFENSAVCYLNGRNEIKKDVKGSIQMMGERNFYAQLTSDLIERQKNKKVVDEIDIGTEQDRIRFKNYQG